MDESRLYRVEFSEEALRDLRDIAEFIARDNLAAAERFGQRLIDEAEAIALHPHAGRIVPEFASPGIRERIHRSYRIVYEIREPAHLIVVSRFWHAARGRPELPID
ncbi:MAG TPA: type II toxin-antitoxin system RelE/ParE family toxin [Chthoniobacteraceae bacterium]|jgi:plasmid stabilization system protein ParE|nr:type II toxin-antitoxin system RelE/ParE family toxin [Chthoniobacteraceae bacterium]